MEKVEYFILVCRSHFLTTSNLPSSIPRKARPNTSTTAACDVGQLLILRLGRKGNSKHNGQIQPLPLSAGGDCREICVVVAAGRRITAYLVCPVQPINMQSGPGGLSHEDGGDIDPLVALAHMGNTMAAAALSGRFSIGLQAIMLVLRLSAECHPL